MRRFFVRLLPAIRTPSPLLPQRHIISSTSRLIRACGYYPVDRRRDMSTSQQPPQAASLSALHGIEFSSNTDPTESTPRLLALLGNPNSTTTGDGAGDAAGTKWALTPDKKGLQREFRFKTFKTTWDFMNAIASKCSQEKHHPEWTNLYNKVTITWTTHRPLGLSYRDLTMAEFCDEQARERGEVVQSS